MDYEKAYNEALKKIRDGLQPLQDGAKISGVTRAFLEEVFPELKETEDEKMWKLLKKYVHRNLPEGVFKSDHITREQLESWLEKQEFFTKKDVDDAYLNGVCAAKHELEKQNEQDFVNIDYINGIRKELLNIEDNAKNINCLTDGQWVAIRASYRLLGKYVAKNSKACDYTLEKQQLIDKACEWLKSQACCGYIEDVKVDEFIEQFKEQWR